MNRNASKRRRASPPDPRFNPNSPAYKRPKWNDLIAFIPEYAKRHSGRETVPALKDIEIADSYEFFRNFFVDKYPGAWYFPVLQLFEEDRIESMFNRRFNVTVEEKFPSSLLRASLYLLRSTPKGYICNVRAEWFIKLLFVYFKPSMVGVFLPLDYDLSLLEILGELNFSYIINERHLFLVIDK